MKDRKGIQFRVNLLVILGHTNIQAVLVLSGAKTLNYVTMTSLSICTNEYLNTAAG